MNPLLKVYTALQAIARHPLHRRHKWRAMREFTLAQFAARWSPGDVCVPFPNGTQLLISPRMKGAAHFIHPRLCEFEQMSFVMHFLRPADWFADVGANVGAYTVLASGAAGARTVALEPSAFAYRYLQQNVRLNRLEEKVTPLNLAAGRATGTLRLTEGLGTENAVVMENERAACVEVRVTTLDREMADRIPALIKIDVEGFETEVLAGAMEILQRPEQRALIVERANSGERYGFSEAPLHRRLREMGFVPCTYAPIERTLHRLDPDVLGNIIYAKDFEGTQALLKSAPPYRLEDQTV